MKRVYAKGDFVDTGLMGMWIVFVHDSTYVEIFVGSMTAEDEQDATSLINAIYF